MESFISVPQLAVLFTLTVFSVDIIRRQIQKRAERKGYPLPPGPTTLPILGSALSVNPQEPFRKYTEWQKKYGDIIYTKLLGMEVVVLNSRLVASDLLDKRSGIYSDRPYMASVDLYGHDCEFGFSRYGDQWRLCRRIFHQTFRAESIPDFRLILLSKARQLILNLVDHPHDYKSHYSTFSTGVAMRAVYDYDPEPRGDPMVTLINDFSDASFPALLPEKAILLQLFPFVLHIPDGLPWSSIKREAKKARELSVKMMEMPYQYVRRRMLSKEDMGTSMVSDHIIRMEKLEDPYRSQYEVALKQASVTAYLGSAETIVTILMTFTLAMVKHPHICKRAQAELDAVVGTERLPEFEDRPSLPYVDAVLRETLRWHPPVPVIPHATMTSDIYNGFYIPKGAVVIVNAWAISRDETQYPNPEMFIPERFLDLGGRLTDDESNFIFGFGRRMCPGRHLADASLWIAMVTLLATFDLSLAKDSNGKDIEFEPEFRNGITRFPLPFPCRITPRSHIDKASVGGFEAK